MRALAVMLLFCVVSGAVERNEDVEILSVGFSNEKPIQSNVRLVVSGEQTEEWYVNLFVVNGEEKRVVVAIAIRIASEDKREKRIVSEWIITERNIGLYWFRVTDYIKESRKGFFTVEAKVEYPIESGNISEVKSKLYVY